MSRARPFAPERPKNLAERYLALADSEARLLGPSGRRLRLAVESGRFRTGGIPQKIAPCGSAIPAASPGVGGIPPSRRGCGGNAGSPSCAIPPMPRPATTIRDFGEGVSAWAGFLFGDSASVGVRKVRSIAGGFPPNMRRQSGTRCGRHLHGRNGTETRLRRPWGECRWDEFRAEFRRTPAAGCALGEIVRPGICDWLIDSFGRGFGKSVGGETANRQGEFRNTPWMALHSDAPARDGILLSCAKSMIVVRSCGN